MIRPSMAARLLGAYLASPDHPTKLRLTRWIGRRLCPRGVRSVVEGGVGLYLSPMDRIEALLLRGERYEPLTLEFLRRNLVPGDGAALAGVNFGLHVIVAARAVGPSGRVVGVEPQPRAIARSQRNFALNDVGGRIEILHAALGETPGRIHMAWSQADNAGAASLFDAGDGFDVDLITLEQAAARLQDRAFRLLLLDVQGYEFLALRGLGRAAPEIVVIEMSEEFLVRAGVGPGQICGLLEARGYLLRDLFGRPVEATRSLDLPEGNMIGVRSSPAVDRSVWFHGSER